MSKTTINRNEKFKVIPNLSLKGPDIMRRLQNRTLILKHTGVYNLEEKIDETRRMSKIDIARKHIETQKEINQIQTQLTNANSGKKQSNR